MRGLIGLTTTLAAVVLLRGVTLVGAHDHGDHSVDGVAPTMSPTEVVSRPVLPSPSPTATAMSDADQSYFGYPQHAGWIHAHIAIMTVAWVFVLPPGAPSFVRIVSEARSGADQQSQLSRSASLVRVWPCPCRAPSSL